MFDVTRTVQWYRYSADDHAVNWQRDVVFKAHVEILNKDGLRTDCRAEYRYGRMVTV